MKNLKKSFKIGKQEEIKKFMSRLDKAENNMDKWYGLALGQCVEEL